MDLVPETQSFLLVIIVNFTCRIKISTVSFLLLFLFLLPAGNLFADQGNASSALAAAREAGLSDAEINRILAYGYDIRISTDNAIEFLEILTDARKQGYSVDPLFGKIDEGLAKRVSFEVLRSVLRKKVRDYQFILDLYRKNHSHIEKDVFPSLQRAADSIDLGLEYEELRLLFNGIANTPADMYTVAAINMAFLKQLNFNSDLSLKIMQTGLKYKSLEPDWKDFFKIAVSGKRKGKSEEQISEAAIKILKKNQSIKAFIQELGLSNN